MLTKINFRLQPDDDGYPPVAVESLWANQLGVEFVIDSIPFFTREATVGDVVHAVEDDIGSLWFESLQHPSQNSLIRIVFFDQSFEPSVVARLTALGCGTEGMKEFKLLAVDVPHEVNLLDVQDFLRAEASAGHLDYQEALLRH